MRRTLLALSLSIIIVIIAVIILVECGGRYQPPPKADGYIALPTATLHQPAGEPAITPTVKGVPAFTANDVIKYIQKHNMPFNDTPPGSITAINVQFITSKAVNKIIARQGSGIPDNYLLCFVTLTGTFTFPGPPESNGRSSSGTYRQAYEVFDATTGNLLMGGALGQPVVSAT